ncbi:hypothetical protein CN514_12350 [Bacillus sp. AFS001701]|uniref:DUF4064 domain-containing protein n=1 Tax=Bacillus sp. AFS001701 TaxID=2033480 RepID=UPI000BF5A28A|nr:DUF4064 domain-containing protein [Bacillus sp. AFS001701]PET65154.1 hypothetical protein CN514_12350 [Bacillus sp. AFS001701]
MKRTAEMVLGILGSIFAFGSSFFALFFGTVDEAFNGKSEITSMGGTAFFFSVIALIFAIVINWKPRFSGIVLVISGIVILVSTGLFGVLPAILIVISGLMGIFRKVKKSSEVSM